MVLDRDIVGRIEQAVANDAAAVVAPLNEIDASFGAMATPVAGGQGVVLGPGMYVNRGLAMGASLVARTGRGPRLSTCLVPLRLLPPVGGDGGDPAGPVDHHRASGRRRRSAGVAGRRRRGLRPHLRRPAPRQRPVRRCHLPSGCRAPVCGAGQRRGIAGLARWRRPPRRQEVVRSETCCGAASPSPTPGSACASREPAVAAAQRTRTSRSTSVTA